MRKLPEYNVRTMGKENKITAALHLFENFGCNHMIGQFTNKYIKYVYVVLYM